MAIAKRKTRSTVSKASKTSTIRKTKALKATKTRRNKIKVKTRAKHDLKTLTKKATALKNSIVHGAVKISDKAVLLKDLTMDVKDSFYELKDTVLELKKEAINARENLQDISHELKKQAVKTAVELQHGLKKLKKETQHITGDTYEKIAEFKDQAIKKGKKIAKKVIPANALKAIKMPSAKGAKKSLKKITKAIKSIHVSDAAKSLKKLTKAIKAIKVPQAKKSIKKITKIISAGANKISLTASSPKRKTKTRRMLSKSRTSKRAFGKTKRRSYGVAA